MHYDFTKRPQSTFLSCPKDLENIIRKLFVEDKEFAENLIRLLVINEKDWLDNRDSKLYQDIVKEHTISKLIDKGYIRTTPKLELNEHEEVMSYILISFDDFTETSNPQFRDNIIRIDVICHTDCWDLGDFRLRPLEIVGHIDGLLNNTKMSGIGVLLFNSCGRLILDKNLSGYSLVYEAVHGSDDYIVND